MSITTAIDQWVETAKKNGLKAERRDFLVEFIGNHMSDEGLDAVLENIEDYGTQGNHIKYNEACKSLIAITLIAGVRTHCREEYPDD